MISRRSTPRRTSAARDRDYLDWLRDRACVICGQHGCDPAHTASVDGDAPLHGMAMKGPDDESGPLCRQHHDEYDGHAPLPDGERGHAAFERYYGVDMVREGQAHYRVYQIWREMQA